MLDRNKVFSLAFLSFLVFSPALLSLFKDSDESSNPNKAGNKAGSEVSFAERYNASISDNEFYSDDYTDKSTIEVPCENSNDDSFLFSEKSDDLPPPWTCFDIVSKFSFLNPNPNRCSPRDVTWQAGFGFASEDLTGTTFAIRFFWDFDNNTANQSNVSAVWDAGSSQYRATANHTYPQNGSVCTFRLVARLRINSANCTNANGKIEEGLVVWDDLSNANLGTQDINHDATSAGVEVGETVEVCRGDDSAVRLLDASTFNCTAPIEPTPTNENTRSRWVQWVYGTFSDVTTGPGATEKIIIKGVSYTNADLPIYGNPSQQPNPPGTITAPNAITDNIQMPTSGLVGERFEVTIRSFNICNPYSTNNDLLPPQGGPNNVFQINGSGVVGTEQAGLNAITGGLVFYANDNPVTRTFDIVIAAQPADPTTTPNTVCNGSALPDFTIAAAGNVAVEWYEDNAGAIDFAKPITNSNGNNSLQLPASDFEPGGGITSTTAGIYNVWARYSANTGSQNCWSNPVQVRLTIREALAGAGAIAGSTSVCNNSLGNNYTIPAPAGIQPLGGAEEYVWSSSGGGGVTITPLVTTATNVSVDFNLPAGFGSATRTLQVLRRYQTAPNCPTSNSTLVVTIYEETAGGTVSGTSSICDGSSTGNLTVSGHIGNVLNWERRLVPGAFGSIGQAGMTTITDTPPGPGTYEYRAVIQNNVVCLAQNSAVATITVNPIPLVPTIAPAPTVTICEDASVMLTGTSDVNADSWQWYKGGVAVPGETNPNITLGTVAESGSYTVEAFGVAPTLCTNGQSAATTVTINPLPTASNPTGGGSVCGGNPAPDIVWTLTGTAPFMVTYTDGTSTFGPIAEPTNTFRVAGPLVPGNYQITALSDANSCNGTSLGGFATVSIGGTPPLFDSGPSLTPTDVCDDGGATTDPQLVFSLDDIGSASQVGFILTYTIDASGNRTKNFDTDAVGDPTAPVLFTDAELDGAVPNPHVITVISIQSPAACQTTFNTPLNFTVNPRPADATNPVNNVACSTDPGNPLNVDAPPAGNIIHWYQDLALTVDAAPAFGALSGAQNEMFTPTSSATATYYAVVESTTGPTNCQSNNSVAVTHTQDLIPTAASAGPDFNNCSDTDTLNAVAADNGGLGTWTVQNVPYYDNFDSPTDNGLGAIGPVPTITEPSSKSWTIGGNLSGLTTATRYLKIGNNRFEGRNLKNEVVWFSSVIDISGFGGGVDASVDLDNIQNGQLEASDYIHVYYKINGGAETFFTNGNQSNDFAAITATANGLTGATLQIVIRIKDTANNEEIYFDNVIVTSSGLGPYPLITDIHNPVSPVSNLQIGANVFTWTVNSALNACVPSTAALTITRNALPAAIDTTPSICEDTFGSNSATIPDLTVYNDGITGIVGSTNRTIEFFDDVGRLPADLISPPTNHLVTTALNIVYTRVTRTDVVPNCTQDGTLTFTIVSLPDAIDQNKTVNAAETEFCEDFPVGSGVKTGIDLTTLDNDVVNNLGSRTVAWYTDAGYSIPVPDATNASANDGTIFYPRVTETASGQSCTNDATVTITVNTRPADNPIQGAGTQCVGGSTSLYQINPGPAGTTYSWNVPAQFTIFGGGTINDFFVLLQFPSATTQTLEVTEISPDGCAGNVQQLPITVQASPPISAITGPAAVCENQTGVVYSVTNTPNTTYAWTVPAGASIILGQGTNSITVNFGATGGNVQVVPSSTGGCSGGTATLGVTVNQRPILDAGLDKSVCSDDDIQVTLAVDGSSPVAAASYNITGTSVSPGLIANVGPTSGNGLTSAAIFNDNYTNKTGGPLSVTYTVVPVSAASCDGSAVNIIVTINPEPVMATGLDVNVCSDIAIGLTLNTAAGSAIAASYNVTVVSIPGGLTAGGGNAGVPFNGAGVNYLANDTYTNTGNAPLVVQYTVEPVSGLTCVGDPLVINATIDPEPVVATTLDKTVCSDDVIALTLNTNGVSVAAATYNIVSVSIPGGLTAGGGNAAIPGNNVANSYLAADTYTNQTINPLNVVYEVRGVSAATCEGDSEFITITIDPEPVMSTTLGQTVCSDLAIGVTFASVGTAVAAADYNVVSVTIPGGLTPGGGNAVFPANNVVAAYVATDTYTNQTNAQLTVVYEVRGVSASSCVGDSELINVNIDPEPVIDPALDATVCSDLAVGVTLATNGTSVAAASYDLVSVTIPGGLTPAGTNVLFPMNTVAAGYFSGDSYTNVTNAPLNVVYEVRGTSAGAGCVGDSEFITVTINPEPVVSTTLNTTVCSDIAVGITFATTGTSVVAANYNVVGVTIPVGLTAGGGNVAIPANTVAAGYISADSYTNQTASPIVVTYEVVGVSGSGCVGDSEFITATIDPEPVVDPSLDTTVCSDAAVGVTLNTNGISVAAANYNIIAVTVPGAVTAGVGNAVIPANSVVAGYFSGDTYTNKTNTTQDVIYEVKGVSAASCIGDSEFITVTINPEPIIDNTLGGTVCSDATIGLVLGTDIASTPAVNYNVIAATIPGGLTAGGGNAAIPGNNVAVGYLSSDTYTNPTNGSLNVVYEVRGVSAPGCEGDSEFITYTIDPEPVIDPALDATVCSDVGIGVTLNTDGVSVAAANYNVKSIVVAPGLTAAVGNAVIPGNGVAAGYIFSDSYTNVTNGSQTVVYEVTGVSAATCEGDSEFITVTIDPEPVVDPALDTTVCSDAAVGVTLNTNGTSIGAANYNIIAVTVPGTVTASGGNVAIPANGVAANYFIADTYTNQTNASANVVYEVRGVSAAGCIGDSEFITVTINPEPVISNTLDATVCSDDVIGLNLAVDATSVAASNYNVTAVTIAGGLTAGGANAVIPGNNVAAGYLANDTYTNPTNGPLTVVYDVQGVSALTCVGDVKSITITIDPEPVIDPALDATVCSDAGIGVTLNTDGVSVVAANYNVKSIVVAPGLTASGGNAVIPGNGVAAGYIFSDSYTNVTNGSLTVVYEVTGVSAATCEGDSEFITVTIDPEPVVDPALDTTVCSDAAVGVTLNTNGTSIGAANYNIIAVTVPGTVTASGGNVAIPANGVAANYFTADTYTNKTNASANVIYEVRGVSAAGCIGDSEFITVTINPEPVISNTLDATVCSDDVIGLNLAVSGTSVAAANYDVIAVTVPVSITAAGTNAVVPANGVATGYLANDAYTNVTGGSVNVVYEVRGVSAFGCIGDSEFITIIINPEPVINTALNTSVCSDVVVGVTLATNGTSVAAATYNIKGVTIPVGVTAGGGNVAIPANGVASGYFFSDTYTNQTAGPLNVIYEVTGVSAAACEGNSEFITVAINPEPVIDPALDATVCSDAAVGVNLGTNGTSVVAANYNIIGVTVPAGLIAGGGNVAIPANGVASGYFSGDTYTNKTIAPITVVYEVKGVSAGACIGDSEFINVTIDPEPVVSNALNTTVCSDDIVGVTLATDPSSAGAANYNLINVTISAGLTPGGGNAAFPANGVATGYFTNDTYTNVTNGSLNVTYEVRGVSVAGCIGDSEFIVVGIDPEPVINPGLNTSACSDVAIGVTFATNGTSVAAANYNLVTVTVGAGLTPAVFNVVPANGIGANYISNDSYNNITNTPINVVYEVQGVSAAGCTGNSEFITVAIDPEPVMNAGLDATLCSDLPIGLTLSNDGVSVAAANYNVVSISVPAGLTPNAGNAVIPGNNVAANYLSGDMFTNQTGGQLTVNYVVQGVSAAGCIGDQITINTSIDPEPVINPGLDATVCSDDVVGVTLSTNGVSVAAADYDLVSVTVPAGLTPAVTNATPANGVAAGYFTNDSYTNKTAGSIVVSYDVRGTSAAGCIGAIRTITVTVDPEPVVSTTLDATVCSDAGIGLVLNTNGVSIGAANYNIIGETIDPGLTAAGSNVAVPASGVAAAYLSANSYTNATNAPLTVVFEVTGVSFAACEGDSQFITITIEPGPVVDPNLDKTLCSDVPLGFNLNIAVGSVAAASYNVVGITPNPTLVPGGGNVPPANGVASNYITNDTYQNTTSIALTVVYEVKGVSAATCQGPSEFITITIEPEPVIDPGLNKTVCSDVGVGLILTTNGVSVPAAQYNVIGITIPPGVTPDPGNAPYPVNGVAAGYLSADRYENVTNAPIDVIYEATAVSASSCEGKSRFITVTIDPEPVIDPALDATVCSDIPVGVTLGTNGTSVVAANYNVLSVVPQVGLVASGSNVAIPTNGVAPGFFSGDTYTNTTANPLTVIYEVRGVSGASCEGNSEFITVTIDPEPVINPALATTVCSDGITALNFSTNGTSVTASTYNVLSVSLAAGLTAGANVAIPANGVASGYVSGDTYTNVSANPLDVIYEVQGQSAAGCLGDSEFITVTINPEPVINPALNATVCSDDPSTIVFSTNGTSVAAANYNLISVTPDPGIIADPTNALPALGVLDSYIQNDKFTNTMNVDLTVQYVAEPVSPQGCIGDQVTIILTIHPEPVLDPALSPAPVCSDVAAGVILAVDAGSVAADHYDIVNISWDPALIPGGTNAAIGNNQNSNAIAGDVYTNTSNSPKLATYDIVPVTIDGCSGNVQQVIFTINPAPALSPSLDRIVCSNQGSGIVLTTDGISTPAQDYEVASVSAAGLVPDIGNVALPVTSNNTLVLNGDRYVNTTNNTLTAVYTITPISAAGCRGPVATVTLTVDPEVVAMANNTKPTICSNDIADITLTSPTIPSAGNITFNITAVGSSPFVSGFIPALNFLPDGYVIADNLVNTGNVTETVTYTITPVASGGASGAGCTGASIVEIVTVDPIPSLTPGQQDVVCSGITTNYTITTINSLAGTTYTWPAPTLSDPGLTGGSVRGTASGSPIADTFTNTTGVRQSATYTVTPIGPNPACVGTPEQITVFIDPLPDGAISVDQPVVCTNGTAILGFNMTVGVAPFEIVYGDGTTDFTVSNIANSHFIVKNGLTATTTYTLKSIKDVNGCQQPISGQTVTVTVENPVADFATSTIDGCTPLDVTFTNNNIQSGTQYDWNFGDGSPVETSSASTVNHTFVNNSTVSDISYTVIMTATRTNGTVVCTDTRSEFITIRAGVSLSINASVTEGCSPLLVSFENNSQGVLTNKWFWREKGTTQENDVNTSFFASFTLSNTTTATKTYEVVYQGDRNGCGDEIVTEIEVDPEVLADFSVSPGNTVTVDNPTITITNNSINKAAWTHSWEWGDGQTTTAIDPGSHTYATFGQYEVKLTITDPSGNCTSEKTETITVQPVLPVVDFSVDITEGCRPLTVQFTNLSTSVDPDTYLWEFTDDQGNLVGTSNLENPEFTFFDAGVINVKLSGSNPLGVVDSKTDLGLITVYEIPTASFTVRPTTVFLPDQLLFTSNLSSLADAFEWDFDGDGITDSKEFEPTHLYESAGVFNIGLIATNTATTCSDTTMIEKAVKVVEAGTAAIPNGFFPGSGIGGSGGGSGGGAGGSNTAFLPRIKGVRDDGFIMQIFDRWGHLLFESTDKAVGWDGRDKSGKLYPSGVYVYKLDLVYVSGQQTTIVGDVTLIR